MVQDLNFVSCIFFLENTSTYRLLDLNFEDIPTFPKTFRVISFIQDSLQLVLNLSVSQVDFFVVVYQIKKATMDIQLI